MKSNSLKKLTVTGLFTALAFIMIFLFRFKVSFLTFDFKDAIISIISLLYGPIYSVSAAAVVAVLEFLSVSDTGVYGLIMNFLSSGTYALICGLIYMYKKSFSGAIMAVSIASVSVVGVMLVANIFITPYYMGAEQSYVISMIPSLLLPFNLAKTVINSSVVLIIYKPVTSALKRIKLIERKKNEKYKFTLKSLILLIVSLIVFIASVLFIILYMRGDFQFFK